MPGLDLALAWLRTGRAEDANQLLGRIAAFLDSPEGPRLPVYTVQRARAHALAGEMELARKALERAYQEGFRMTCALDMSPQPLYYLDCIEADPAFTSVRREIDFDGWLARIRTDNATQRERLATLLADKPSA